MAKKVRGVNTPVGSYKFKHIVVLMLENRSFDHLFGYLDHAKPFNGLKGNESNPLTDRVSTPVPVTKGAKAYIHPDPSHSHVDVMQQIDLVKGDGRTNDGFYYNFKSKIAGLSNKKNVSNPKEILACWDAKDDHIRNLVYLAKNYVLCDKYFSAVPGETWPNRNYVHAGTSASQVNIKLKPYTDKTIYEVLADNQLRWRIYHDGLAQSYAFVKLAILGNGGFRDFDHFEDDVATGNLPEYTFIEPRHFKMIFGHTNNMHPGNNSKESSTDLKSADNLVGTVYNTLLKNQSLWKDTLLVVTFDEHGGLYDHVFPPAATNPSNDQNGDFHFDQYGLRVPAILISPRFKNGDIDSTLYDHTSIIKTVLENFGINGNLGERVKVANNFLHNLSPQPPQEDARKLSMHRIVIAAEDEEEVLNDFQMDLVSQAEAIAKVSNTRGGNIAKEWFATTRGGTAASKATRRPTVGTSTLEDLDQKMKGIFKRDE